MPKLDDYTFDHVAQNAADNAAIRLRAAALREDIRETQNYLADPRHYTLEPAYARLGELKAELKRLARLYSCACSRGGNASTCDCKEVFSA